MHETVHIGQILGDADDGNAFFTPPVYEWWDMEVKAHERVNQWYTEIFNRPPPTFLRSKNKQKPDEFATKKKEYIDLKQKETDGTITETEKNDLDDLVIWFKSTLPEAGLNPAYRPHEDIECD